MNDTNLVIIVPVPEWHIIEAQKSISLTSKNLKESSCLDCRFIIVIQTKSCKNINLDFETGSFSHDIFITEIFSVSNARNIGIANLNASDTNVLFMDCDSYLTNSISKLYDMCRQTKLVSGAIAWDGIENTSHVFFNITLPIYSIFLKSFLSSYIFSVKQILESKILFDTDFGPGESANFACGEDLLFLVEYINYSKLYSINHTYYGVVAHQLRPLDNSKRVTYSEGQIDVLFTVIRSPYRFDVRLCAFIQLLIMVCVSFLRLLLMSKKSSTVLRLRIGRIIHNIRNIVK